MAGGAFGGDLGMDCLVGREGDGLPGQGGWVCREEYKGVWEGAEARAYLAGHQQRAFDYWSAR